MANPRPLSGKLQLLWFVIVILVLVVPFSLAIFAMFSVLASAFPSEFAFSINQVISFLNLPVVATFVGDGFLALIIYVLSGPRKREDQQSLKEELEGLRGVLKEDREANAKAIADAIAKALNEEKKKDAETEKRRQEDDD